MDDAEWCEGRPRERGRPSASSVVEGQGTHALAGVVVAREGLVPSTGVQQDSLDVQLRRIATALVLQRREAEATSHLHVDLDLAAIGLWFEHELEGRANVGFVGRDEGLDDAVQAGPVDDLVL